LVLHNLNTEVNNNFSIQPFTVERKLKNTAPVQNSGEKGLFQKLRVKNCLKIAV